MLSFCSSLVIELNAKNWHNLIEHRNSTTVWIVMFKSPTCPACKSAYPYFEKASQNCDGMLQYGIVDTAQDHEISSKLGIQTVPSFIIFHPEGHKVYDGPRNVRGFTNSPAKFIPNKSILADQSWNNGKKNSIILVTNKKQVPPIWAALSCFFNKNKKGIQVGHILTNGKQKIFNLTAYPSIVMFRGKDSIVYSGENDFRSIQKFIIQYFDGTISSISDLTAINTIEKFDTIGKFTKLCKAKKNCVISMGGETKKYQDVANKYKNQQLIFGVAADDSKVKIARSGFYIFHRQNDMAAYVKSVDYLSKSIDQVLEGSIKWAKFDMYNQKEL